MRGVGLRKRLRNGWRVPGGCQKCQRDGYRIPYMGIRSLHDGAGSPFKPQALSCFSLQTYNPVLHGYDWSLEKDQEPHAWMRLYVKQQAAKMLEEERKRVQAEKEKVERERRKQESLKALAAKKAKAMAMKAAMEAEKAKKLEQ